MIINIWPADKAFISEVKIFDAVEETFNSFIDFLFLDKHVGTIGTFNF